MSELVDTIAKLADAGGMIRVTGGKVRVEAPPGLLTGRDREILAQHRDDVIAMLTPVDVDRITPHSAKTAIVSTSAPSADQDQQPEPADKNSWGG